MAVNVKDVAQAAKKFTTRAAAAGADYTAGVQNAGAKWAQKTKDASDSWAAGVAQAQQRNAFANGVTANSTTKFVAKASTTGAQRYPQGVQQSGDAWANGVQPYLNVIASQNLPARGPKGSPQNYLRVQQIGDALRQKKISGTT